MTQEQSQTNYREDKERKEIVQRLFDSGRVYFFPAEAQTGFVLVSNLSTAVLVAKQDLQNPRRLKHIVDVAMEYPLTEVDTEVLQAIGMLRKGFDPTKQTEHQHTKHNYNLLALFCYVADLVSIHPNYSNFDGSNKTFLQACREAGLTMKLGETPNYENLWNKFANVISLLKLNNHIPSDFLLRWHNDWEFDAFGEVNNTDNIDSATYNQLAKKIAYYGGRYIGVGQCISYARGNRDYVKENLPNIGTDSDRNEQMLARARKLISNPWMLEHLIENGKNLRQDRLFHLIWNNPELIAAQETPVDELAMTQGMQYLREHLLSLPLDALRIIDTSDYAIAHVNAANLSSIYPKDNLPSFTDQMMKNGRLAGGESLSRFRLFLDSNGLEHPTPRMGFTLQRWIHESAHIIFGNNGARKLSPEFADLQKRYGLVSDKFQKACLDLWKSPDPALDQESDYLKFKMLDGSILNRSIRSIIDPTRAMGIYTKEQHKEELMVECLALAYTEFAEPDKPNNIFGHYGTGNPVFDNFRAALADVKLLYHDSAQRMVEVVTREKQQQQSQRQ